MSLVNSVPLMASTDTERPTMTPRLGATVISIGTIAALGSILVALGLTDVLAIVDGYRTSHSLAFGYGQAFLVSVTGWALLAMAGVYTVRAARSGV